MEYINGQWYVFYHRQTNRTQFSRQGCAVFSSQEAMEYRFPYLTQDIPDRETDAVGENEENGLPV